MYHNPFILMKIYIMFKFEYNIEYCWIEHSDAIHNKFSNTFKIMIVILYH